MRALKYVTGLLVLGVVIAAAAIGTTGPSPATAAVPVARGFGGMPTVGALFASANGSYHSCTASVVHSRSGNVLLTAAHCVTGTGGGYAFAPGFYEGTSPYGRWKVTGVYVDGGWLSKQDPTRDFAFLTVAPRSIGGRLVQIEQVTGANRLGSLAHHGEQVTIPGYPAGTNNGPITCTARLYFKGLYPAFDCNPYVGGTSGSPYLVRGSHGWTVVGLIGGLHQGGCTSFTSYSSPLGKAAERVYLRAVAGKHGDEPDPAGGDGC